MKARSPSKSLLLVTRQTQCCSFTALPFTSQRSTRVTRTDQTRPDLCPPPLFLPTMASINVGMPETDPVLLHAREHLRAQQNGAVNAVRRRFVCFVPGCPVQCTKTEDLKRHFNRGWHSDANAGAPADWDADQVFTVPEADWLAGKLKRRRNCAYR